MKNVDMEVFLLAKPALDWDGVHAWLDKIGGLEWFDRVNDDEQYAVIDEPTSSEFIGEMAGRRCYQSWAPGINPNVNKVRTDSGEYLRNIVKVGHGSVLEHAQFTFALEGISRVVTHELVRHRHASISQESLRYVRLTDIPFRLPEFIEEDEVLEGEALDLLERMENFQALMAERTDIDNMASFHDKKKITSDMRRFAPIGLLTGMVWSANIRTLRFVIESRTSEGAEEEIRVLFNKIGEIMMVEAPLLFGDFETVPVEGSDVPAWIPARSKV